MALNGYFGKPGSGKSYSIVEYVVIPALKNGRHVVTNIPLEGDLLEQVFGGKVTQLPLDVLEVDDLEALLPHGCVAVIDEVWWRWPSGQKVNRASPTDLRLLKEHRHRVDADGNSMQVVLATQDPSDVALWVRNLIAHSFHMEKLDSVGLDKRFGIKVYKGCPTGDRIPKKLLIREAYGNYKPDIYQYYKSATQSQASDLNVGDEKAIDKRKTIWSSGQMLTLAVFIPLAFIGGGSLLYSYLSPKLAAVEQSKSSVSETSDFDLVAPEPLPPPALQFSDVAALPGQQVQLNPEPIKAPPALSGYWRVVGFMSSQSRIDENGEWLEDLVILKSWGGMRTVPMSDCYRMPASRYYACEIDGELVTPWSGQQGTSEVIGGKPLDVAEAGTSTVVSSIPFAGSEPATQSTQSASGAN